MMQYSFGILSYNQERYILELLESIKYQVVNYGKSIQVFLYLSDDASTDRTVELVRKWLADNECLFYKYEILTSINNKGTTNSYYKLLDKIETEFFKIIAGDDVFAKNDIFEELKNNKCGEAVAHIPLLLKDGKLELSWEFIYKNLIHKNEKRTYKKDLQHIRYGGYINTPSFFPTRSLINEKCIDFMRQFKIFEDDPTWYMLIKTNEKVSISFDIKIKVLYRIHNSSVSNSYSIGKIWYDDMMKLKKYYIKDNNNFFLHIFLRTHMMDLDCRYRKDKQKGFVAYRIIDKMRRIITNVLGRRYLSMKMYDKLYAECIDNQKYYNEISKLADQNLKKWGIFIDE